MDMESQRLDNRTCKTGHNETGRKESRAFFPCHQPQNPPFPSP
jgi:hypothetical protein